MLSFSLWMGASWHWYTHDSGSVFLNYLFFHFGNKSLGSAAKTRVGWATGIIHIFLFGLNGKVKIKNLILWAKKILQNGEKGFLTYEYSNSCDNVTYYNKHVKCWTMIWVDKAALRLIGDMNRSHKNVQVLLIRNMHSQNVVLV